MSEITEALKTIFEVLGEDQKDEVLKKLVPDYGNKEVKTENTKRRKLRPKQPYVKHIPDCILKTIIQYIMPALEGKRCKHRKIATLLNDIGCTTVTGRTFTPRNSNDYFERNRVDRYQNKVNIYRIEIGLEPILSEDVVKESDEKCDEDSEFVEFSAATLEGARV